MSRDMEREWKSLYDDFLAALKPYGCSDSYGNGDFWLVTMTEAGINTERGGYFEVSQD